MESSGWSLGTADYRGYRVYTASVGVLGERDLVFAGIIICEGGTVHGFLVMAENDHSNTIVNMILHDHGYPRSAAGTIDMPEMQQRDARASIVSTTLAAGSPPSDSQSGPRKPSSIPPWVHINDNSHAAGSIPVPAAAKPNTRHYKPPPAHYKPGRKWDHLREAEPPLLSASIADRQVEWNGFMDSGPNPNETRTDRSWVADRAWMEANMPYLSEDFPGDFDDGRVHQFGIAQGLMDSGKWLISPERQEKTVRLFWRLLLKNPFVPLVFRLLCLTFSAASLGIAATILEAVDKVNSDTDRNNNCSTRASTYIAICVGSVAIPYVAYVTWDEYMSKPYVSVLHASLALLQVIPLTKPSPHSLGLRSVAAKTSLLLCDLYFIVFSSSNLSLAFDALFDHRWACYDEVFQVVGNVDQEIPATCPNNAAICHRQGALSGILLVGLITWLVTFGISVMRVVEKLRTE
nr:regulator of phospholipase d srf1 [Quercus suber]